MTASGAGTGRWESCGGFATAFRAGVVLLAISLLPACGEFRPAGSDPYLRYKVKPKETLYAISFRFGYDYREVAAWNDIDPPYTIWPGQEIVIPSPPFPVDEGPETTPSEEPPREQLPGETPKNDSPSSGSAGLQHKSVETKRLPLPPLRATSAIRWGWPTSGKLVRRFDRGGGLKGINLSGRLGQPIRAAADGEVVYSGDGLIGYGKLVIIRHDDVFLSAYGHNRRLLVKEGERVKAGQMIGEMGRHPKSGSILHFEIRRNGKPVDPLLYLPNQTS